VGSELFELAYHRARERELKVKREKPVCRRFLEADATSCSTCSTRP